jgi:hypothetical protein
MTSLLKTGHDAYAYEHGPGERHPRPARVRFQQHAGAARPGRRHFWAATSTGAGDRVLTWDKTHGAWSLVVMREDGSPHLDVRASIGLRFGFLMPLGIGLLAGGVLALAAMPVVHRGSR